MKVVNKNIRKSYGTLNVLDDISFNLKRGEIVGLLGRNGAGKSTLLKIIAGINQPDEGTIAIHGNKVGYMSERNPLYPHMYVVEYLEWIANVTSVSDPKTRIEWIIDNVGLTTVRHKKIHQLSKGFKQRLGLAATLLPDPEIIILDEPINGLDPIQINEYRELIRSMASQKIIILSSHLMQEIEAICDRVLLLKDGKIEKDEPLKDGNYSKKDKLLLKLNQPIPDQSILAIEGVYSIEKEKGNRYILTIDDKEVTRLRLFDHVVAHNCKIVEMTKIRSSLEKLFN